MSYPYQVPILLVEDEDVSRRALAALLNASGYRTEAVESAEDALDSLDSTDHSPQLALIDLNLPGMSGLDLIDRLEELAPSLFPILITATSEELLSKAMEGRELAYVRKPLNFDHLLTVLQRKRERH